MRQKMPDQICFRLLRMRIKPPPPADNVVMARPPCRIVGVILVLILGGICGSGLRDV